MTVNRGSSRNRGARALLARLATLALVVGGLAMATSAGTATVASAAGGGAAATVANGLTTTDLSSVGMSPSSLASTLVGPGVTVSNVTYSGANAQAGTIHVVDPAVVSFNDGIILSSGNIADVVGPNKSDGTTGDMAGPNDPQLDGLIANTQTVNPITFDAASLEFDFVPSANQVYFTYTFASDEYLEWVNLFNDVFAFYVNGQNCATVPNGDPVSIDTINSAVNPNLFRDNSFSSPPANPINFESDGLSVEMICSAPVNAGQVNHMKLAIADTSDQILDSVVMIKAQSLSTTKPESCNDHVDNDDDLLVDDADPSCTSTTTPPPTGGGGIGSSGKTPPFTGNEGTPILLDGEALNWHASNDTISTTWTVDGINGTTGSCDIVPAGPQAVLPDRVIAPVSAICPNEGEYVARVEGWDAEGSSAFDKDVDFFVHNAPPAVSIDSPSVGTEATVGSVVDVTATVADPGATDSVSCTINWGDGTTEDGSLADGTCTGSHTYDTTGSQMISVTATDDAGDSSAAATVAAITDVAVFDTFVTSSANPSVTGQAVTYTATTNLGGAGTMRFYDGGTLIGSKAVSGGTASLKVTPLAAGTHSIVASFLPSGDALPSDSAPLDQQVDPAETTTTLSSTANPSTFGQSVGIKATVKAVAPGAGVATGTVELYDGGTLVGTKTSTNGTVSFSLKPTAGTHAYTATYSGSPNHQGSSTTAAFEQHVGQSATSTVLVSNLNPAVAGQRLGVTATVKSVSPGSGIPTGTVDIYDGDTLLATKTLVGGTASLVLTPTLGAHPLHATYSGSSDHLGSTTSTDLLQVVAMAPTTVAISSSANPSAMGQYVTIKARVATVAPGAGYPTGTVSIYQDDALVGTATLVSGLGSVTLRPAVGTHTYTAAYGGSATQLPSATATGLTQTVNAAATTTQLISGVNPSVSGQTFNLKAVIKAVAPGGGAPTGTVDFYDGATLLGTRTLGNGSATIALKPSVGVHDYTATYSGSESYTASATASPLVQTVNKALTKVVLGSQFPTTTLGHVGTIATVVTVLNPATGVPTGSVEIYDGSTLLTTLTLVNGKATMPIASLPVGVHELHAVYVGDANDQFSITAAPLVQTIS